jgi:hypothetical protein
MESSCHWYFDGEYHYQCEKSIILVLPNTEISQINNQKLIFNVSQNTL